MFFDKPAYDYDSNKPDYTNIRKPDPNIAKALLASLGEVNTLVNIGAGSGAYEPTTMDVTAVEPSQSMRETRLAKGLHAAIEATADKLPFDDNSFDAAMASLTIHHWPDLKAGLEEIKRVTKKRLVILTFDPDRLDSYWSKEYFPEVLAVEGRRYPKLKAIQSCLPKDTFQCQYVDVPRDCEDGFQEAFYARPEAFLESEVRKAQSAWGFIDTETETRLIDRLKKDLNSGEWDKKYGYYRNQPTLQCGLCIVTIDFVK
ncbi:class I SAM-dependent methyltransferase [Spirochaeta cellobiosiphila]|uniref:class I SAM-dependent methyltransferase n=1 Tax=Spirochaeta cellobiosiphila TaxID=504483 RepID=UPI00040EC4CC|nr:class I SAM-dependent methyltransferase [Spirochaeta cellobiosiphila]